MLVFVVVMSSALIYIFYATKMIQAKQNVFFNMHDPRMVRQDDLEVWLDIKEINDTGIP